MTKLKTYCTSSTNHSMFPFWRLKASTLLHDGVLCTVVTHDKHVQVGSKFNQSHTMAMWYVLHVSILMYCVQSNRKLGRSRPGNHIQHMIKAHQALPLLTQEN